MLTLSLSLIMSHHTYFKVMFLQKTPVPQELATKHAFANALGCQSIGVPLVKYEEMFNTENEER